MTHASYAAPEYLRRAARNDAIAAVKQRTYEWMRVGEGSRVLDVGCGPGVDTIALAAIVGPRGEVTGVDHDANMIDEARRAAVAAGVHAWTTHQQADVAALPFAHESFDAVRSERVLQHLVPARGAAAIAEALRVVRRGGHIVLADTDWATLSVDTDENDTERRLTRHHAARFFNPFAGRQLARMLKAAGCIDVIAESHAIPLAPATVAYLLSESDRYAVQAGAITAQEWWRWRAALNAAEANDVFFAHLTMVVAAGTRP